MQCSVGSCSVGLATQDQEHVKRFNMKKRSLAIHKYLESIRWQLASITNELGYSDMRQLSRDDLVALTPEVSEMTRLPYDPSYRERYRKISD
jgi:glutamate synthase domain-containing protein 2